jgi:hypothetical protein
MAKAHIKMRGGATVTIEGTPEEVATLVAQLGSEFVPAETRVSKSVAKARGKERATPVNLISSLIDGGFFRKPKDLASVKVALEEIGHFYPITTLSPALLRLVRKKQLRRLKEKNRWLYTG